MDRRSCLSAFLGLLAVSLAHTDADAAVRRRVRRRIRRRVRRRFRRAAIIRVVAGRRLWVVPVAAVVGWELLHENRVVVIKETKFVERDGAKVEVAVVQDNAGKTEQIDILREDNAQNGKELGGSEVTDDDKTTPRVESEIEEEVEG